MKRSALLFASLVALSGCFNSPSTAGKNCSSNSDCSAGERCANDVCTPGCRTNSDCPSGLCHPDGTCGTKPECGVDTDCPAGFSCQAGRCGCTTDYSCWLGGDGGPPNTHLICVSGACEESTACDGDADCTSGRYCGPAGVCTAPCIQNSDCGGSTQTGGVLTCNDGRCTTPCLSDDSPLNAGGCKEGQICQNSLCQPAQCATAADCGDPTLYCTSATHGRCAAVVPCDPAVPDACGPLAECTTYPADQCPPGFDCTRSVCIQEPPCLTDGQCGEDQICEFGGCRTAPACNAETPCAAGFDCIGGHCSAHVCRGPADCGAGEICTGGVCTAPSDGGDIDRVKLLTPIPTLEVGQTEQLAAIALNAGGVSEPVDHFDWSVDDGGAASVSATGLLTAVAPGSATVTVGFTRPDGSHATPDSASFQIVAAPASGRALVIDSETGAPIAGASVRICPGYDDGGACASPIDVTTDASGEAAFTAPGGTFDLSAADPALDSRGKPVHDVVHILGLTATDVLVPLPKDEAGAASGFTASIDYSQVSSSGNVRIGLAGSSIPDLASLSLEDIVGQQPWIAKATVDTSQLGPFGGLGGLGGLGGFGGPQLPDFDGGTIQVPLTGGSVADVDSINGLPITIRVKDTVYALGAPGTRTGWAFAGKIDAQIFFGSYGEAFQTGAVGGVLPFFGAFDHGLRATLDEPLLPEVLDQRDLDGNGVCEDATTCATGGQYLPDYSQLPSRIFRPAQPQSLRVDVTTPEAPGGANQLILLAGAQLPGTGLLPLGLSSASGGPGTGSVVLRMAPLYGGFEASGYTVLAVATGGGATGFDGGVPAQVQPGAISVAIARDANLPTRVDLGAAMLPFATDARYSAASRTLSPGTNWASIAAGTQLVRIAIVGQTQRAFVYAAPGALGSGLRIPRSPVSANDPALDASSTATLVALQLPPGDELDEVASTAGVNLLDLSRIAVAFTRAPLQ